MLAQQKRHNCLQIKRVKILTWCGTRCSILCSSTALRVINSTLRALQCKHYDRLLVVSTACKFHEFQTHQIIKIIMSIITFCCYFTHTAAQCKATNCKDAALSSTIFLSISLNLGLPATLPFCQLQFQTCEISL